MAIPTSDSKALIPKASSSKVFTISQSVVSSQHTEAFRQILNEGIETDVTFYVGQDHVAIHAHKLILSIRAPGFRRLLESNNNFQNLEFGDIEPDKFRRFLDFIYTGEFPQPIDASFSLLQLAIKFQVKDLLEASLPAIRANRSVENCCKQFQLFYDTKCEQLIKETIKFIWKNAAEIFKEQNEGFLDLSILQLQQLLNSDNLEIDEMKLFDAILCWGKNRYTRESNHFRRKSLRVILEPLIPFIRFPLMQLNEFAWKVPKSLILTEEEVNCILIYLAVDASKRSQVFPGSFSIRPRKVKRSQTSFNSISPHDTRNPIDEEIKFGSVVYIARAIGRPRNLLTLDSIGTYSKFKTQLYSEHSRSKGWQFKDIIYIVVKNQTGSNRQLRVIQTSVSFASLFLDKEWTIPCVIHEPSSPPLILEFVPHSDVSLLFMDLNVMKHTSEKVVLKIEIMNNETFTTLDQIERSLTELPSLDETFTQRINFNRPMLLEKCKKHSMMIKILEGNFKAPLYDNYSFESVVGHRIGGTKRRMVSLEFIEKSGPKVGNYKISMTSFISNLGFGFTSIAA